jgi:hypothetical protein
VGGDGDHPAAGLRGLVLVEGAEPQHGGLAEADLVDVDGADADPGDQAVILRHDAHHRIGRRVLDERRGLSRAPWPLIDRERPAALRASSRGRRPFEVHKVSYLMHKIFRYVYCFKKAALTDCCRM